MTTIRSLLALVVLGSVTAACGSSSAAPPATIVAAVAAVATTQQAATTSTSPVTTVAVTTTMAVTTTTEPRTRAFVEKCMKAASVDLGSLIVDDATLLQKASSACMTALQELTRLHGAAGAAAFTFKDELLTFVTALEYAKVNVKYDVYDESAHAALLSSVLEFQVAATKYLAL